MQCGENHPTHDYRTWEQVLRGEVLPEGHRSGRIRLLSSDELSLPACLVASGAPRNPSGTHASGGYPGGRKAWIRAFECWATKMPIDSLLGTLRRPYQHAAQFGARLPRYDELPARNDEATEVRVYCWPEDHGLTVWRRPAVEWSLQDWEDLLRLWVAEIKYRKQVRNSNNPYEDAEVSNPEERIRDWEAAVNLSRQKVLKSSQPWEERTWIKCACDAIWTVNRLVSPRGRIVTASGKWEPLPNILVPSPSSFNSQAEIHLEIEEAFNKVVEVSETEEGKRLDRIIGKDESIRAWWRRLCSLTHADLVDQSDKISHLWKEAENQVRESHGFPRIGEGWISEVELLNLVRQVFPNEKVTHQAGPEWLGAQRIDIFMPERRVAIEYQGEQHYEPVDFFGGEEGLRRTQERDRRKARLCAQNRVQLVYFRFDEAISRDIVDARIKAVSAAK